MQALLFGGHDPRKRGLDKIAIHLGNKILTDALRTDGRALSDIGTAAKALGIHPGDHIHDTLIFLHLTLREQVEMSNLGRRKEHG